MIALLRTLLVLVMLATGANGHIDAVAYLKSVRMSYIGLNGKESSVEVVYTSPFKRDKIESITIQFFDKAVVIPANELEGIENIQLDSMQLRFSQYEDGRRYCYVDSLFGPAVEGRKADYKRVWLLAVEGEYEMRRVFPSKGDYRTESVKQSGKPETKEGEQGVAPQSATRSESDSEGGDKPQPESEARPR